MEVERGALVYMALLTDLSNMPPFMLEVGEAFDPVGKPGRRVLELRDRAFEILVAPEARPIPVHNQLRTKRRTAPTNPTAAARDRRLWVVSDPSPALVD